MNIRIKSVLVAALISMMGSACGFEVVDTGRRGIKVEFGKVMGEPLPEGLHFYNPFTSNIVEIDVREQKVQEQTECFTKDTQHVLLTYAVTFYPDPSKIHQIYQQFGEEWESKIVQQKVLGSIKDTVGQYIADDLVAQREVAKKDAEKELVENLGARNVIVTSLDFVNLDFDDAYEKAVEQKVVAMQEAAKARNKTVEVDEKAKQQIRIAQAEAEAMRIKTEALSKSKGLVEYEAIQKWNGQLPTYMFGGSVPMINIEKLKQSGGQ
jgi:regulator of protease activity HflC (stomatin/prohibitin superfamily)